MRKTYPKSSVGVGNKKNGQSGLFKNHFASMMAIPRDVQFEIDSYMMHRVAGNVYECPADRSFWAVKGGRILKLVGNEVDNGESIPAAPEDKPAAFLAHILDDLDFG